MRANDYRSASDAVLWELWKRAADARAGTALCDRYFFQVLRFFSHKVRSDRDAEDLTQKTFLELVRSTAEPVSVIGYLFGVARFVLIRYIGGVQKAPGPIDTDARSLAELDPGPGVVTLVAQDAERSRLVAALRRLPIDQQILLELHYWEELSGAELAEVLAIPLGTVRSRLATAKRRLADTLADLEPGCDGEAAMQGMMTWVRATRALAPTRRE